MRTFLVTIVAFLPVVVFAQQYQPLVGIPLINGGVSGPGTSFNSYINSIYALSISFAALLAVIKIVIAGMKWMMTDVVTTKGEAKKDIQGALVGLLIVLAAVIIINQINPRIAQVSSSMGQQGLPSGTSQPAPQLTALQQAQQVCASVNPASINCTIIACTGGSCVSAGSQCNTPGSQVQNINNQQLVCLTPVANGNGGVNTTPTTPGITAVNTVDLAQVQSQTGMSGLAGLSRYAQGLPGYLYHTTLARSGTGMVLSPGLQTSYELSCVAAAQNTNQTQGLQTTWVYDSAGLAVGFICHH